MTDSKSVVVDVSVAPDLDRVTPGSPTRVTSKGIRFWLVLSGIIASSFIAVLEGYAVSTALPTMVSDLHADQFLWVASAYAISSTVLLPLIGELAQVFGRRVMILGSLVVFMVGAAICGAAQNMNMLIAGRVIHGAGSGGIASMCQIILSDLVTLKERGVYNGMFGLVWALGGGIGPLVGGVLAHHTTWRWLFYLNIPVAGVVLFLLMFCLRLQRPPSDRSFWEATARLDLVGDILVIGGSCSIAIALTWGGVQFAWSSTQVLVPLCIGFVTVIVWVVYEFRFCARPAVPFRVLSNRTSWCGYTQIFVAAFVNINLIYYLPVYYQACKDASPTASGVDLLGLCFSTGPISILIGISVNVTKRYRPQLWLAWCLVLIGMGLISTVTEDTSHSTSVGYQIIAGVGIGIVYSAAYFPVLAPFPVTLNAAAVAFFVFLRSFAQIWGVTIGGALLQNELQHRIPLSIQDSVQGLDNIAYAVIPLIPSMQQPEKDMTRRAFAASLATVWRVVIAVAGVGLLASIPMQGLPLHTSKDEAWALREAHDVEQKSEDGRVAP